MAATLRKAAIFIAFLAGAFELTRNTPFFYNLRGYSAHSRVKVSHVPSHKLRNSSLSSRPVSVWTKHGYVSLFHPFAVDLTVAMDVEINPGPNTATLQCQGPDSQNQAIFPQLSGTFEHVVGNPRYVDYANFTRDILTRRYVYSRDELYRLRPNTTSTSQFRPTLNHMLRRTAYRGCRAGKRVKDKRNNSLSNIPTVVPRRPSRNVNKRYTTMRNQSTNLSRSLISVKIEKTPTAPKVVPKCMVINARSLVKADAAPALYAELSSNNIGICFVSESWLNKKILSHLICPDGYVMVRKDRNGTRAGGGVKVINANEQFETLWCKVTTPNSQFFAASVYHPPDPIYEPADLLNFLSETCDQILHDDPNAKIVIAGDTNQLNIKDLMQQHGLHQMVKVPTRRDKILDVFLTNCPLLWKPGKVHKGLVRSDHLAVIVQPSIPAKPQRKYVSFRDTRDHRKIAMETKLSAFDWNSINNLDNPEESAKLLYTSLWSMFNESFPLVRVRVSSRDRPPW